MQDLFFDKTVFNDGIDLVPSKIVEWKLKISHFFFPKLKRHIYCQKSADQNQIRIQPVYYYDASIN